MRKIFSLAKREYLTSVKSKGFIIGLIIAPLFMSGSVIAIFLLKDRVDTSDKHVLIMDHTRMIGPELIRLAEERNTAETNDPETGKKVRPAYIFSLDTSGLNNDKKYLLELSDRVRNGDLHGFLEIGENVLHPAGSEGGITISYYAKNAAMDDLRGWLSWPINNHLRKIRLSDAGINESDIPDLFHWMNIDALGLVSVDKETGQINEAVKSSEIQALLVPIAMMMLMFLMVMMSVPGMLHSVMEEKTQKIAEVLLGSIRPFEFMAGKVIGGIAVSATISAVYLIGGAFSLRYLEYDHFVPFDVMPWFIAYLFFAVIMFGTFSAAMGSVCSEAKDAQNLSLPVMLPIMIPMFVYFPVAKEPLSHFATVVSLIPPFTPMLMLLRQATPEGVPLWQPIVGLAGVILLTVFNIWAGGRIFRIAILMQGTPPKMKNILKWLIRN